MAVAGVGDAAAEVLALVEPWAPAAGGGGAGGAARAYLAVARSGAGPGLGCCGVERDYGLLLAADPVRR